MRFVGDTNPLAQSIYKPTQKRLREDVPKIYSKDLLDNLFRQPYTRIEFVEKDLNVSRPTATKHLDRLAELDFLTKTKVGRSNYYVNLPLAKLLTELSG